MDKASPDGPLRRILQSDRGTEEGHDPVTLQLVHRPTVLIDCPNEDFVNLFHQAKGLLRIELLRHGGVPSHIGEQHRHLFALPFDPLPLGQDFFGQIFGKIMLHLGDLFTKSEGGRERRLSNRLC